MEGKKQISRRMMTMIMIMVMTERRRRLLVGWLVGWFGFNFFHGLFVGVFFWCCGKQYTTRRERGFGKTASFSNSLCYSSERGGVRDD